MSAHVAQRGSPGKLRVAPHRPSLGYHKLKPVFMLFLLLSMQSISKQKKADLLNQTGPPSHSAAQAALSTELASH